MNSFKQNARKVHLTLVNFKQTANHHYGTGISSYFKLLYISGVRLNTFLVFEKDLTTKSSCKECDEKYRIISPDMEMLNKMRAEDELPREFYADETYGLKTCYIALNNDEIAYLQWHIFKGDYSRFLELPEDVVEFNYMVVMPKFRGQSLSTQMVSYFASFVREQGYKKAVAVIHNKNYPAIKAYEKAGFSRIAKIKSLGQFNRKYKIALN